MPETYQAVERERNRLRAERDRLRAALQLCAQTIDMFLNQSGAQEIRDSFQREVRALKVARAALRGSKGE